MKKFSFLVVFAILQYFQNISAQTVSPPVSKKVTKVFTEHGRQRIDDYYWMNNPSDTNVINHLKEENAYLSAYMKHTEDLQKYIYIMSWLQEFRVKTNPCPQNKMVTGIIPVLKKGNNIVTICEEKVR